MKKLLEDDLNLKLMQMLCAGEGVDVNITELSKSFNKHRNTIKQKITQFIDLKIIEKPRYTFNYLFTELPLIVIEKDNFSRDPKSNTFIEKDPAIWAAFFVKEEEYNTLMIVFHKDLHSYQNWREDIIEEKKVSLEGGSYPSEAIFLSAKNLIKYDPAVSIQLIEGNFRNHRHTKINGLLINEFGLEVLKYLITGRGIKTNENYLSKKLNVHRRTVKRRIEKLLSEKILTPPICSFPRVWVPPEYFLVFSLLEIKRKKENMLRVLKKDPHIPVMFRAVVGRYNLALFSAFYKLEDFLEWAEEYDQRFPGCIGAVKNTYLSPEMTFSIAQNYVSLLYIQTAINRLRGKVMMDLMLGEKEGI